jgi:hypothetical protein
MKLIINPQIDPVEFPITIRWNNGELDRYANELDICTNLEFFQGSDDQDEVTDHLSRPVRLLVVELQILILHHVRSTHRRIVGGTTDTHGRSVDCWLEYEGDIVSRALVFRSGKHPLALPSKWESEVEVEVTSMKDGDILETQFDESWIEARLRGKTA